MKITEGLLFLANCNNSFNKFILSSYDLFKNLSKVIGTKLFCFLGSSHSTASDRYDFPVPEARIIKAIFVKIFFLHIILDILFA